MIAIVRAALLLFASTGAEAQAAAPESRAGGSTAAAARPLASAGPAGSGGTRESRPRFYVSVSRLIGTTVYGPDEKRIGSVRDVLFGENGRASAIVVSSTRWMRGLPRYYRAAWSTLEFTATDGRVTTRLGAAELAAYAWSDRGDAVREGETRARTITRSKVLLENRARHGNVRDILFDKNGNMWGLVIIPLPKLGDRRGDRQPYIYSSTFDVDSARRRITLPYSADEVPRGGAY
jgi:hypothetical protein